MIADRIFNLESFQKQFQAILQLSVSNSIDNLKWQKNEEEIYSKIVWNNVLGIASILSQSEKSEHLDAALRIAQTCITSITSDLQKAAATVILENLTNTISIGLAIKRDYLKENYAESLPVALKIMSNRARISNSVVINDQVLLLNRFQKRVYDASRNADAISLSAPTSAGKSFILYQLLIEELKQKNTNIVYLVPTRALISQVEEDLSQLIIENKIINVNLTTVPLQNENGKETNLFVFTQERLHWYLHQSSDKRIDFLLVDEAHKIDNGNRGVLLERKIEDVIKLNPEVKLYFSSPFTSNPEILLKGIRDSEKKESINTEFVAVNQNLLFVKQRPKKTKIWDISLILKNSNLDIGNVELSDRPTPEARKISLIAKEMAGENFGNLIYANGAAESEKYSKTLYEITNNETNDRKIQELILLVKKTIHPDYILAKVLKGRIAFHYGNMPLLIRQEIESLFKNNCIKFLVCTSTLLEGVNLPATSVFIKKPTRGRGNPLSENDFWNLAGRAGRWGKEFTGNIVCIDPHKWENIPSPNKRKQKIEKALDTIVEQESVEFLEYIKNKTPRDKAEKKQDFEFAFSYFYTRYLEDELKDDSGFYLTLNELFDDLKQEIEIPLIIIQKNPGISPIAQQKLLEYFREKIDDIDSLIPVYPEDDDAYNEYIKLIARIGKTLADFPPQLNSSRSLLLIQWMTGKPLSFIIKKSVANYKKNGKEYKIDQVCRNVMEQIENFARFRFAKESSCYIDILKFFLNEINRPDLLKDIPELNLWLEFGVSLPSQLSLLALGLSRNTVIFISDFSPRTDMSKKECMDWLKKTDLSKFNLSPIMIEDVNKTLRKKEATGFTE